MGYWCSDCKENILEEVYNYSMNKYNKALCKNCQKTFENKDIKENGLSKKESQFTESIVKGRIAETLIEELFLRLKYNVFRYGMENTVPGIMSLLKGVRTDVALNIRTMPDFVIQNPNTNEVYFIEVKFRANEEFSMKDLKEDYPYENCYFIVVSKKHIKCITYNELKEGKEITPNSQNYLGKRKEFDLDKDTIIDFCNFAIKFFKEV